MLEKEWYDVEIEDEFFDDDVKDLKGFDELNKKEKSSKQKKQSDNNQKDNLNELNLENEIDFSTFISNSVAFDESVISKEEKNDLDVIALETKKNQKSTIEEQEIKNIVASVSNDVDNLEDDEEEKTPKLSFEDYVLENEINLDSLKANISAALYIAGDEGLDIQTLKKVVDQPSWFVKKLITIMIDDYWRNESIGISIELYQKVFKFVTKPKCFESLGKVINTKFKNPLSQSVMETLAIIAYNQPCRRSVIEKIRAKDPKSAIDRLLNLELITAKQSDLPGRPFVYTVTSKFYDLFDLKFLSQLPRIETRLLNDLPTNESEIED